MKSTWVRIARQMTLVLIGCFLSISVGHTQPTEKSKEPPRYRDDRIILKPRPGVAVAELARGHAQIRAHVEREFPDLGHMQVVKLPPGMSVAQAIKHYQKSGTVAFAEPDYEVKAVWTPNDPAFVKGLLWGLNNTGGRKSLADADIDAPEAWDVNWDAHTVVVAVIDTGVRYTHEDLAANMWVNEDERQDDWDNDGNGYIDDLHGINAILRTGDPFDDNGHGTHVAGTIGAVGDNGLGVVGVAPYVKILACKFLDASGSGYTSNAITCIDYARSKGAKIMSNSWGGGEFSQALYDAISEAGKDGILFVAAAGNSGANADISPMYPAAYDLDNIISVAATDRLDQRASFSNYGIYSVDLGAPGVDILSSVADSDSAYAYYSGTSMACPHVSGAAALVWAKYPGLTYLQVKARLLATVDPIAALSDVTSSGGRLNVYGALTDDPIAYFTASPTSVVPGLGVSFVDQSICENPCTRTLYFGDTQYVSDYDPSSSLSHSYGDAGTYLAKLTVTGSGGTSEMTIPITVAENYTVAEGTSYSWVDTKGLESVALGDDSVSAPITLPFPFSFYGQPQSTIFIDSNGFILFGSPDSFASYFNTNIPNPSTPNQAIYAYWDDLNPAAAGQVNYGVVGSEPNRIYVVSWEGVPRFGDPQTVLTFQVLLFEGTNDIVCQYKDTTGPLGGGASATIGVENADGTLAQLYSFNRVSLPDRQAAIRYSYSGKQESLEYADLSVTMSAPDSVQKGANLTYTITVSKGGEIPAANVVLTDTLPAGTTFVSAAYPNGWTLTTPYPGQSGTVTGTISSLDVDESYTFTVVVTVNAPAGTILTNVASVTSDTPDVSTGNNQATDTTKVTKPGRTR